MKITQEQIIASMPSHLRPYTTLQHYDSYTAQDHAVWRFLLRELATRLEQTAHPIYLEGLEKTGISLDAIPNMDDMNEKLADIGWSAVVVDGVIPSAVFMELQALKILPIALDMRSIDHMLYTPAPDIVHEAAGHAPFIIDLDYADYLQRIGEIGVKALSSKQDYAIYEAVRKLSILKEDASRGAAELAEAQRTLEHTLAASNSASEAYQLSRLHWWTVEYGLVGNVNEYKIFGAGLLSSLGESGHCLDDQRVKKIPLTVAAINCPYDITCEQPQLFVTKSCKHLSQVLESFANGMAFKQGGAIGLQKALDCATVATVEYSSGIQLSGVVSKILTDAVGNEIYVATSGPSQLAYKSAQLLGHGIVDHPKGIASPVGQLKDMPRCLSVYTIDELRELGIYCNAEIRLEFLSGVTVVGCLKNILRRDHKNLLFRFSNCTVTGPTGETLFRADEGDYDMAIGERVVSVYGGAADKEHYPLRLLPPSASHQTRNHSERELALFSMYQTVRNMREADAYIDLAVLCSLHDYLAKYPKEWLLRFEILELLPADHDHYHRIVAELMALRSHSEDYACLIDMALASVATVKS